MTQPTCVLCGGPVEPWPGNPPHGYGHNPEPCADFEEGRCCNTCNDTKVIPARLRAMGLIAEGPLRDDDGIGYQ